MRPVHWMETESTLAIDSLGRLLYFSSVVKISSLKDEIRLRGMVEGSKLSLSIRNTSLPPIEVPFPKNALLKSELSPQTQLPGLRRGQTWTIKTYSPWNLLPANNPLKIYQAAVEGIEPIYWDGRPVDTWLVIIRDVPYILSNLTTYPGFVFLFFGGWAIKDFKDFS